MGTAQGDYGPTTRIGGRGGQRPGRPTLVPLQGGTGRDRVQAASVRLAGLISENTSKHEAPLNV